MMFVPTLPQKKPIICQDNIDLSFELIQIRFPVRLEGRNRGGEIIPERCRNALTVQGFEKAFHALDPIEIFHVTENRLATPIVFKHIMEFSGTEVAIRAHLPYLII